MNKSLSDGGKISQSKKIAVMSISCLNRSRSKYALLRHAFLNWLFGILQSRLLRAILLSTSSSWIGWVVGLYYLEVSHVD